MLVCWRYCAVIFDFAVNFKFPVLVIGVGYRLGWEVCAVVRSACVCVYALKV